MFLTKHHGFGNDFLVALEVRNPDLTADASRSAQLCDRHRGLGADGVIYGLLPDEEQDPEVDINMVLHNADGSLAEISGNGIRCLGQAVAMAMDDPPDTLTIRTLGGIRELRFDVTDAEAATWQIQADMGPISEGARLAPWIREHFGPDVRSIDIGNPHVVIPHPNPSTVDLASDGAAVERAMPHGANVHFMRVRDPHTVQMSVWERGIGVTEACGSGACAVAALAADSGAASYPIAVQMPGGTAVVDRDESGNMLLKGEAVFVAEISVPDRP